MRYYFVLYICIFIVWVLFCLHLNVVVLNKQLEGALDLIRIFPTNNTLSYEVG